ncbi:MAG: hypothetical protein H8E94_05705 [Alphaproteobacteria bacterium]|nr:hypothetical protein [Alphaproteobacteria bacterium]
MDLNLRTLFFAMMIVAVTVCFTFLIMPRARKSGEHIGLWTFGNLILAIGSILMAARGVIPQFISIIVANILLILGIILLVICLRMVLGKKPLWKWVIASMAVFVGLISYFTYVEFDVLARIAIVSFYLSCICAWAVSTFLLPRGPAHSPQVLLVFFFGLVGVSMIFRLFHSFSALPIAKFVDASGVQALFLVVLMVAAVGWSMGFLWLLNQRLTQSLLRSNDLLKRSNTDLEGFAWALSHDLRSPLTAISLYLGTLDEGLEDPEQHQIVQKVFGVHRRMVDMIDGMLKYATVEGAEKGGNETVPSRDALDKALANLEAGITETNAVLSIGALPVVWCKPVLLSRLFQNLIGNAVKFRHPGQPPTIDITADKNSGFWHFKVRDEGIGVASEDVEDVFSLFGRGGNRGDVPGTGVGLAECRRIIHRHGGRIWVESEPGKGSTFHFTLPIGAQENDISFT